MNGSFCSGSADEYVGAKVFDKSGGLVYLNQLKLSGEKTVGFSFPSEKGEEYTIILGMKSRTSVYMTSAEGKGMGKISVEKNGGEISSFDGLTAAESISVCAEIFDRALDSFAIAASAYKDGGLCGVSFINKGDMVFDGKRYTIEIPSDAFKDADMAGFFIFNSLNSIMPIDKSIKLRH